MNSVINYFRTLADRFGQGWNRFWFTPRDPYTASALRLVVGLLATWWLFTFTFDLGRWFGPAGLLPAAGVSEWRLNVAFSLLDYTANPLFLWGLHALSLGVLLLWTAGLWTRVTGILSLLVVLSYIQRAPMLAGEAEDLLAMLMLYLCIAPAGAYLSLDRWWAKRRETAGKPLLVPEANRMASSAATVSLRLIQVHLTAIFVAMALAKLRGIVWWNGEAVWWMAARGASLVDLSWLANYPYLVNAWTHAIVAFELLFALLVWNRTARPLMLGAALVMWAGMALLTGWILFPLLMIIASLAFVPSSTIRRWFSATAGRAVTLDADLERDHQPLATEA